MENIIDKLDRWLIFAELPRNEMLSFGIRLDSLRQDLSEAGVDFNSREAQKLCFDYIVHDTEDFNSIVDEILAAYEMLKLSDDDFAEWEKFKRIFA